MKKITFKILFLILGLALLGSCDRIEQIFDSIKYSKKINPKTDPIVRKIESSKFKIIDFTEQGRIFYGIKIWGVLKYFPLSEEKTDINQLFVSYYSKIKEAESKQEFAKIITNLIHEIYPINDTVINKNMYLEFCTDTNYFTDELRGLVSIIKFKSLNEKRENKYFKQNQIGIISCKDNFGNENGYPDEALRLWGLANYWNYINYFYVYNDLMDENWDSVLYRMIPHFANAQNVIEYTKVICKLTACLNDCHSIIKTNYTDSIFGEYIPNFRMKRIGDTFVVNQIRIPLKEYPIEVGDIILSINNQLMLPLYDSLKHFFAASNLATESRTTCPFVLSSFNESNQIVYSRKGYIDTLNLKFMNYREFWNVYDDSLYEWKDKSCVKWYGDIAYVPLEYLQKNNFNKTTKELNMASNIILDIRTYPNSGVSLKFLNWALPSNTDFFKTVYADVNNPGTFKKSNGFKIGKKNNFQGKKIRILVDENTQSEAEFLVMGLQQHPNVKVIGSTTAASNGNYVIFKLPGNIQTSLSGIGITYPDNGQTQRIGIRIDTEINYQIANYQTQKDIILETALKELEIVED